MNKADIERRLQRIEGQVRHCVADAVAEGGPAADERLTEATAAVARLLKS